MQRFLITTHMHVLMLGVILAPLAAAIYRGCCRRDRLSSEQNQKLCLDVATVIPVGVLLWNLLVYYAGNSIAPAAAASAGDTAAQAAMLIPQLTYEKAIAAAGESTVALATAIIFCRLASAIWADLNR
jgi:hypothetical protein